MTLKAADKRPKKTSKRRVRQTVKEQPLQDAPEGLKAAWFRQNVLKVSRSELATWLDVSAKTIEREEAREAVSTLYRLACAALVENLHDWQWDTGAITTHVPHVYT